MKTLKTLTLAVATLWSPLGIWAATSTSDIRTCTVDGVTYKYRVVDWSAEIYGGKDDDGCPAAAISRLTAGELKIPSELDGYEVSRIGSYAFSGCVSLTAIRLPETVEVIDEGAFWECWGLSSMSIPPYVESLGSAVFGFCGVTNVVFTGMVPTNCKFLFADDETAGATGVVSLEAYLEYVEDWEKIMGQNGLWHGLSMKCERPFDYQVVEGGVELKANARTASVPGRLEIPAEVAGYPVVSIGQDAFRNCKNLTTVVIAKGDIKHSAFAFCANLKRVYMEGGVTSVGCYAFQGCAALTSVGLGDGLKVVGEYAFAGCTALRAVTIPSSVTRIGQYAFANSGVANVVFEGAPPQCAETAWPSGARGEYSSNQSEWKTALDATGKWCGLSMQCALPYDYEVENGEATIIQNDDTYKIAGKLSIPSEINGYPVTAIGECAFGGCVGITSVRIPASVKRIGDMAFYGCSNLENAEFSDGVETIGNMAFSGCRLTSVTIPASVTLIDAGAFCDNQSLATFVFEGVPPKAGLGWWANPCNEPPDEWGERWWEVGEELYGNQVTGIYFSHQEEWQSVINERGRWYGMNMIYKLPYGSTVENGEATIVENEYTHAFVGELVILSEIDGYPVTAIDKEAFTFCCGLVSVTIPNTVLSIGDEAFSGCDELLSVEIPEGVQTIGDFAFAGCWKLKEIRLPASIEKIGFRAFWWNAVETITFEGAPPICLVDYEGDDDLPLPRPLPWYPFTEKMKGIYKTHAAEWRAAIGKDGWWNGMPMEFSPDVSLGGEDLDGVGEIGDDAPIYSALQTYNGYLYDSDDNMVGTIQVRAGKVKRLKSRTDDPSGTVTSKLTATIQLAGEKKIVLKGTLDVLDGALALTAKDGRVLDLELGEDGIAGTFGDYKIDGARDVFASKASADKVVAADALAKWKGTLALVFDGGSLTVTVGAKGKAKVSGTLASGAKVSASAQMVVGDTWCCIPVAVSKKSVNLAFSLWLSQDGETADAVGLGEDVVFGRPGALGAGATLVLDADALADLIGDDTYAAYFPDGVSVEPRGKKWVVADGAKAGKVVLDSDGEVDETKAGANPSALKLTYKAKDGSFTGSFKAYVNSRGKPKAVTVSVSGVVVGGVGYGSATVKRLGSIPVTIE